MLGTPSNIKKTKTENSFGKGNEKTKKNLSQDPIQCRNNLVPRSHSVTGNVRSGKVRFRACSVPARPEIRAFLSLRMFVLSVVIMGDFAE